MFFPVFPRRALRNGPLREANTIADVLRIRRGGLPSYPYLGLPQTSLGFVPTSDTDAHHQRPSIIGMDYINIPSGALSMAR
jgi:hypothetical protein